MMTTLIIVIFIVGYLAIAFEHALKINKAAAAIITGVLTWVVYVIFEGNPELVNEKLAEHLGSVSGILFFLIGAMAIVELIDAHNGFEVLTGYIKQTNKRSLIWVVGFISFFLSAILDNLTTTIVMVSLLRKLIKSQEDRLIFIGIVIVAANAGGAWTPIGDVTTTMLWIGGNITPLSVMEKLFIPSVVTLIIPLIVLSFGLKGKIENNIHKDNSDNPELTRKQTNTILILGVIALLFVPVFKSYTHLPPFMGILLGVGILWVVTEIMHGGGESEDNHPKITLVDVLRRIDIASIIFFSGILLAVAALESTGVLHSLSEWMTDKIGNQNLIVMSIGVMSSVVDNVPLVAAAQGMYSLTNFPVDSYLWTFLAYCAGTGGSILIIGSAAGVAAMGLEKISFVWYLRKIGWLAFIGFLVGAGVFVLIERLAL